MWQKELIFTMHSTNSGDCADPKDIVAVLAAVKNLQKIDKLHTTYDFKYSKKTSTKTYENVKYLNAWKLIAW